MTSLNLVTLFAFLAFFVMGWSTSVLYHKWLTIPPQPTRDCCDELISAALNVESNQIVNGFTLQCEECNTWWTYKQAGANWWERIDTNERRAVELREDIGMNICGVGHIKGHLLRCNLPRGHNGNHQDVTNIGAAEWPDSEIVHNA